MLPGVRLVAGCCYCPCVVEPPGCMQTRLFLGRRRGRLDEVVLGCPLGVLPAAGRAGAGHSGLSPFALQSIFYLLFRSLCKLHHACRRAKEKIGA